MLEIGDIDFWGSFFEVSINNFSSEVGGGIGEGRKIFF